MAKSNRYRQEPVAIVGFACRLPGGNMSPQKLWDFLERGDVASSAVPETRFSLEGHFDGSLKPKTMRQPGGMFIDNIDPADFDAGFFEVGGTEATAMDPNQRQMLEVLFESLENAGITLENLDNQPVGCFVGSYAADYADMQNRDPEDRPANNALGVGRAILANRLSHFLNIKGPSVTLDTACSSSLQGLDLACRYLQSGEINTAIVAASNLYMSPEHLIDTGNIGNAHSPTALCHTFDVAADGYVKAEAVSTLIVKRLEDATRDRDPIRAIILGTASTSNGRTAGIASPSAESQALAIQAAYSNAGITDLNQTTYLECHGTGTQAGDPTEVRGVGSVFAATRPPDKPLLIGSVKSNIGHSEPAAGNSGLLKTILSMENRFIPGTPTFINPSPKINFVGNKVKAFRTGIPWPEDSPRRASINSFGYGGSNAHVIIEHPDTAARVNHVSSYISADDGFAIAADDAPRPSVLVLSANDAGSLRAGINSLSDHLISPRVQVSLSDLAYTLSERRTKLWHRAFITTRNTELGERAEEWVVSKKSSQTPTIGFVFTGQGAQWSQMGKDLLLFFPRTREILQELDDVLHNLSHPPSWSLISELSEPRTSEHLRQPEFSQPLVTALQLCIVAVLEKWGIRPSSVVGHSSGEIAAAYAAGLIDRASAITAAYYRGKAAVIRKSEVDSNVGMLAVGLSADETSGFLQKYASQAWIACFNSPSSVTVSGKLDALEALREEIAAAGHFARRLQVDMAYHSELMHAVGDEYESLLLASGKGFHQPDLKSPGEINMFSSVTASKQSTAITAAYWKQNMVSAVRFDGALSAMMLDNSTAPNFLIEIGPSGALSGPVSQVLKSIAPTAGAEVSYCSAWSRGVNSGNSLFDVAGRLWATGHPVDLAVVNEYDATERSIIDLPNYCWNHSTKYWHENASSKDWRFRKYVVHDLLGSKILGTSWHAPTWRSRLNVADVPFLLDHRMGGNAIMPGAGFVTMALEAMYQKHCALLQSEGDRANIARNDLCYRFRNVRFSRALVLEEGKDVMIISTLAAVPGSKDWHEFRISTTEGEVVSDHCSGLVRIQDPIEEGVEGDDALPLASPQAPKLWYKRQKEIGMEFGPAFQRLIEIEAVTGERACRTSVSLEPPEGKYDPQSYYPIHPAALDGCLQTPVPSNACGDRTNVKSVMIPVLIDDFIINKVDSRLKRGRSKATSVYSGRGRLDLEKSWTANTSVYDAESGQLVMRITGMNYARLDVAPKPDPHTFHSVVWKQDIDFLTQDQVMGLTPDNGSSRLDTILDLIAHKKPALEILEIDLDGEDTSCIWFGKGDSCTRAAYSRYDFASPNAKSLVHFETLYKDKGNVSFHQLGSENALLHLPTGVRYDLAIVKTPDAMSATGRSRSIDALKPLLANGAFMLIVNVESETNISRAGTESPGSFDSSFQLASTPSQSPPVLVDGPSGSVGSAAWDDEAAKASRSPLQIQDFMFNITIAPMDNDPFAYLSKLGGVTPTEHTSKSYNHLIVAHLSSSSPRMIFPSLQATLKASGWSITHQSYPFPKPSKRSVILVLDELWKPVLTQVDNEQWEAIKMLIGSGNPLLWVTKGAQGEVTNPDSAMVHGLFRVARQEDPTVNLTTLDVQSSTSQATTWVIEKVLWLLRQHSFVENEYMEREGMLHIARIMPDNAINDFRHAEDKGLEPVVRGLHSTEVQVKLRAERLGTLQSLMWCETKPDEVPDVGAGNIEVEVMAVGVNFKDVAITMGIVPDNEYEIGFECAGVVRKLGLGVDKFKVGDRVCMLKAGSYANRIRVSADRCHAIPALMTFEEAATIPSVYLCSLYAMYHLGGLKEGQSVLIHSATGGVGIACIELALHKKAEIFVTVGTEEKRQFLESNYDIPRSHMFSSRNTKFAPEIMKATGGRGVNVIINSLVGELLDASWRIMADGGNMVEIGKRDIVDRNTLSMEPFDRNCSFRAVDMSYTRDINDKLVASLFDELFVLIDGGHIKPIHPITTFGFDHVVDALSYIRSGRHLGKIVISNAEQDVQVPIRPALRSLRLNPDVSYLIVGGLKGACGTLTIHMAQLGARHIIINNRSGISDEASARIVASCKFYGCEVSEAKGDVGNIDYVRGMFKSASPRIAGIIQGAMVLRDKPFETMTLDDYHVAIRAKVEGTKNLHQASKEIQREPLDFFTMLSSTSGVVGNKGQANYAAANTFLDAFASYRHSLGLRANTVDLGLIEDVGYVAEQGSVLEVRFDKRQWTPINEEMMRKILTYSILQQDDSAPLNARSRAEMITGIGYPLPNEVLELAGDPRFGYLFNSRAGNNNQMGKQLDGDDGGDQAEQATRRFLLGLKSGADVPSLNVACVEVISAQAVKILRLEADPEAGRPLVAYGLDSLSAVELRNWIRMKIGAELTTLDITNASSLISLCEKIVSIIPRPDAAGNGI
ncbi:hypothetical protein F5X99DRAFT_405775 [Biscogniauxia marginata]|nr:hypothetical protein F5X99DRAFT_405775 [Biscogniauxia marginata]